MQMDKAVIFDVHINLISYIVLFCYVVMYSSTLPIRCMLLFMYSK